MYLTAIDLGSAQIKALVSEVKKDGSLAILKVVKRKSAGIKRGEIVSCEELVKELIEVLEEIKHFDKKSLKSVVFGISGTKSRFNVSRAAVSIPRPNFEILQEDVDRVIRESMAINLPAGWQIIHSLPREFIIDDIEVEGMDVVGLSGRKLEANVVLISVFSSIYNNFLKTKNLIFGKKNDYDGGIIFSPLAAARAVLSSHQKDLGVALIDIGWGTTSLSVWQEGRILMTKVLPIGSGNITNDLAVGLKCSPEAAEEIKVSLGFALAREVSSKEKVDLEIGEETIEVSKRYIAEIIEARIVEIFNLVGQELKNIGRWAKLPAGVVLSGGGAKLAGVSDLARQELKLSAQLGLPAMEEFEIANQIIESQLNDPEMAVAAGLLLARVDNLFRKGFSSSSRIGSRLIDEPWWKKIFKTFMISD